VGELYGSGGFVLGLPSCNWVVVVSACRSAKKERKGMQGSVCICRKVLVLPVAGIAVGMYYEA
jgi:hypothetical protein